MPDSPRNTTGPTESRHTMTVAIVPRPWPAQPAAARGAWRFAKALEGAPAPGLQWVLRRNCSFSPRQLLGVYLLLCVVSLAIALGLSWHGASPVLAFAGIELLLIGLALLLYARHATDHERITLAGDALCVEHQRGSHLDRKQFRSAWVRVEPSAGDGSLVELSGEGRQVRVGRYLGADQRAPLAQELRAALRTSARPTESGIEPK